MAIRPEVICSGFRKCGVTPFDPDAIMKSLPEGNERDNNSDGMEAEVNGAVSEEAEGSSSQVPRSIECNKENDCNVSNAANCSTIFI